MTKAYTLKEATQKLERYCAYQERCHQDVRNKLKGMRMIPEAIDQIVTHLIQENFLNEQRFAKSFARGKFSIKKWGRDRIVRELRQRAISQYNIAAALKQIEPRSYLETFDALAEKRMRSLQDLPMDQRRRKLANYLLYRGWENHLVFDKVKELCE